MLGLSVAVLFCPSLGLCRLFNVRRCCSCHAGILALSHLGIDNLNVVRSNGRMLDADC